MFEFYFRLLNRRMKKDIVIFLHRWSEEDFTIIAQHNWLFGLKLAVVRLTKTELTFNVSTPLDLPFFKILFPINIFRITGRSTFPFENRYQVILLFFILFIRRIRFNRFQQTTQQLISITVRYLHNPCSQLCLFIEIFPRLS